MALATSPPDPLSFEGEGEEKEKRGFKPLLDCPVL